MRKNKELNTAPGFWLGQLGAWWVSFTELRGHRKGRTEGDNEFYSENVDFEIHGRQSTGDF